MERFGPQPPPIMKLGSLLILNLVAPTYVRGASLGFGLDHAKPPPTVLGILPKIFVLFKASLTIFVWPNFDEFV